MDDKLYSLFSFRSALSEDLLRYYDLLIEKLDKTPWWSERKKSFVRISQSGIPPKVFGEDIVRRKTERRPHGREGLRFDFEDHPQRGIRSLGPARATLYEEPEGDEKKKELLWSLELPRIKRAVVLGGPGAGKSLLACSTVIQIASEARIQLASRSTPLENLMFPIHMPFKALADAPENVNLADAVVGALARSPEIGNLLHSAILTNWIRERITKPKCLLVLDALDEVDDAEQLGRISRLLELAEGMPSRIIFTCRTASFRRELIRWNDLQRFDLAPFSYEEIRSFFRTWHKDENGPTGHLEQVLDASSTLEHACRTPIVATLACMENDEAPLEKGISRVDLYSRILRRLAERRYADEQLEARMHLLRTVAWQLFTIRPEANVFLYSEFSQAIELATMGGHPNEGFEKVDRFINDLCHCRILMRTGRDRKGEAQYSFLHRTFFEFLAAEHMARASERGRTTTVRIKGSHQDMPLMRLLDRKSWDPAWGEAIVFLAGILRGNATSLIELLTTGEQDIARHRVALALRCVTEIPPDARNHQQQDDLTASTFSFLTDNWRRRTSRIVADESDCWKRLAELNGTVNGKPLVVHLCKRLPYNPDDLSKFLEKMGPAVARYPEAVQRLTGILLKSNSWAARLFVPRVLGEIGEASSGHSAIVVALLDSLVIERSADIREFVADALGQSRGTEAIPSLLNLLSVGTDSQRCTAARAFTAMGEAAIHHREVLPALFRSFREDECWYVRHQAGGALRVIGALRQCSQHVIPVLLQSLRHDDFGEVRLRAVQALAAMGEILWSSADEAIPSLVRALLEDGYWNVRCHAAAALGAMGEVAARDTRIIPALMHSLFEDSESSVRNSVASALGKLGPTAANHPGVIPVLLMSMSDRTGEDTRLSAICVLQEMGEAATVHPDVMPALIQSARSGIDMGETAFAVGALGAMGRRSLLDSEVMRVLLAALRCQRPWVQWSAADAMTEIAEMTVGTPERDGILLPALLCAFREDPSDIVREHAAFGLGVIGKTASYSNRVEIVSALLSSLEREEDENLLCAEIEALGEMGEAGANQVRVVEALLQAARKSKSEYVRNASARALRNFHRLGFRFFDQPTMRTAPARIWRAFPSPGR